MSSCQVPTQSEKKALLFLGALGLLGAVVRMTGAAGEAQTADAASREALRRQIVAVESAGAVDRRQRVGRGAGSRRAVTRRTRQGGGEPGSGTAPYGSGAPAAPPAAAPVDVDRATAEELERLPRIGPALAARIVQDREARGPFGSLAALERVRGIGPAMVRALAPSVTFSGTPRPSITDGAVSGTSTETQPRKRRRKAPP